MTTGLVWHLFGFSVFALYIGLFAVGFVWSWRLTRGLRLDFRHPTNGQPAAPHFRPTLWPMRLFVAIIVGLIASAPAYLLAVVLDAADR